MRLVKLCIQNSNSPISDICHQVLDLYSQQPNTKPESPLPGGLSGATQPKTPGAQPGGALAPRPPSALARPSSGAFDQRLDAMQPKVEVSASANYVNYAMGMPGAVPPPPPSIAVAPPVGPPPPPHGIPPVPPVPVGHGYAPFPPAYASIPMPPGSAAPPIPPTPPQVYQPPPLPPAQAGLPTPPFGYPPYPFPGQVYPQPPAGIPQPPPPRH